MAKKRSLVALLPIGAFGHPAGVVLEIAPGPEPKQVIVRINGQFDFWFLDGRPMGCGTVTGRPTPLIVPKDPASKLGTVHAPSKLILPNG